jgi:hypothetical protein
MKQLANAGQTGGIVFVGSSMMDAGLDASAYQREIGGKTPVYNASLRSALEPEVAAWTIHIVIPILRPRVVIIGTSSSDLTPNDTVRNVQARQFFSSPGARQAFGTESVLQRADRVAGSISDLFLYRNVLRRPSLWGKRPTLIDGTEVISPLGSDLSLRDRTYADPQWIQDALQHVVLGNFTVGGPELDALGQILSTAGRRGIFALVVNMPVTADFVAFHPHGAADYHEASAAMRQLATAANVPFVDVGVWPTSLFGDPIHLNAAGSQRFTAVLAAPPSHR